MKSNKTGATAICALHARLRRARWLVIWGSRDDYFTVPGAVAYLRDAPQAEVHVLDTVHFATLESPEAVGQILVDFTGRHDLL